MICTWGGIQFHAGRHPGGATHAPGDGTTPLDGRSHSTSPVSRHDEQSISAVRRYKVPIGIGADQPSLAWSQHD
jgi:hypothetical protein